MSTGGGTKLVLVVEDEPLIADVLERYLRDAGYTTRVAADGTRAVDLVRAFRPDLVLLDLRLPHADGFSVLATIRAMGTTPVIIVTARVEDVDRLLGFRLGADDYVVKPFNPAEVVARVDAVLRRSTGPGVRPAVARFGNVEIDFTAMVVTVGSTRVDLTASEFRLLEHLARSPTHVFSRSDLMSLLDDSVGTDRVVDAHIGGIRRKLRDGGGVDIVETVRGVGYRLWPPSKGS